MPPHDDVLELTIAFQTIPPDADEPWPVGFTIRCPAVGASWDAGHFRNPRHDKVLGEIRWYLEEYPKWPTEIDRDRAHEIEANLDGWGRDLFNAVFDARPAARIYEAFLDRPAAQRRVIVEAQSPQVQRLPWELLAESTGALFSRRVPISIYRRVHLEHWPEVRTFDLPLRVLLVTSRPEGAGFIDPRSVARGMLDALAPLVAGGRVAVDFLRPPTLAALDEALRQGDRKGRPYHIVHFDGHGVYHKQTGLGQLAFEHDDCTEDAVDANRLGTLPPEVRALGGVLVRVLAGDREPDLSALPPELAEMVRRMLESLKH